MHKFILFHLEEYLYSRVITQIFVPNFIRDLVSSQSAYIEEINTSEILKINSIQN